MLELVRGVVAYNATKASDASFHAVFSELSEDPMRVFCTSPFYRVGGGGMLGVPEEGDRIIAMYDRTSDEVYYHSTIVKVAPARKGEGFTEFNTVDPNVYNRDGKPVKVTYQNALGAGLDITRNYDTTEGTKIVTSVSLKSEGGKRIALDDSPEIDAVIVRNQHGDGLTITGDETETNPDRTVVLKSNSSQFYTCFEGQLELRVVDGRDIVIENNSTGSMSQTPRTDFWPNGTAEQAPKRYGGIYLRSENGDVSISSQASDGRVFIVTPKGRIQITEDGAIQIDAQSDIQIRSSGNISMKADGDIKLEGANVDIKSTANLTATGQADVSISSNGNLNIDGTAVNLNVGASQAAQSPEIEGNNLNDYNE